MEYTAEHVLRLAKRWENPKRPYLLVNPLQGKHIPASPASSWAMMDALGAKLAAQYPLAKLVIGFAETATAVAAVAAARLGEGCIYLHTTREALRRVETWLHFQEEHSHAVEQKLCGDSLAQWLERTPQLIILDDELSTGRTLRNLIRVLRAQYPQMAGKEVVAASLISRLSPADEALLSEAGAAGLSLVKLPPSDFAAAVAGYHISPAEDLRRTGSAPVEAPAVSSPLPDPRTGVDIHAYLRACKSLAEEILSAAGDRLPRGGRTLVLGTEECMLPALMLGRALEEQGFAVAWQATTRSPIGVCIQPGYPVTAGCKVRSFYDEDRETFLYNLEHYDAAVLVTDAAQPTGALEDVSLALARQGCQTILYVRSGQDVRFL